MIAFITCKSSLVPLLEGLCTYKIASWIWPFDLVPGWLSVSVLCCSVYCVSRLIIMPSKSFARALLKYIPM